VATQETSALLELLPEGDRSQANLREVLASEMQTLWQCPRPLPALNASTFAQLDRELACPLSFLALLISSPSQLSISLIGVCVLRCGRVRLCAARSWRRRWGSWTMSCSRARSAAPRRAAFARDPATLAALTASRRVCVWRCSR
jgi:hypothetical protein